MQIAKAGCFFWHEDKEEEKKTKFFLGWWSQRRPQHTLEVVIKRIFTNNMFWWHWHQLTCHVKKPVSRTCYHNLEWRCFSTKKVLLLILTKLDITRDQGKNQCLLKVFDNENIKKYLHDFERFKKIFWAKLVRYLAK